MSDSDDIPDNWEEVELPEDIVKKKQMQKTCEDGDRLIMNDLFSGCDIPATALRRDQMPNYPSQFAPPTGHSHSAQAADMEYAMEKLNLSTVQNVEKFCSRLRKNIEKTSIKSNVLERLVSNVMAMCSPHMETKDLSTIQNKATSIVEAQRKAEREAQKHKQSSQNKAVVNASSKLENEYDEFYGDDGRDSRDDEEDGDFM
eukprot:GHVN01024457.1.p1 GENE.GHVN01024457.1~~GHVN01024457.1.p1  ORF type:complete len:201 (+),score=38.65 GHVN01024457.1:227-829(+)